MHEEQRQKRSRERYTRLREIDNESFNRAVYIGSLVAIETGNMRLAAKVEDSVVAVILDALDQKAVRP